MGKPFILDHPLIQAKVTMLRDVSTCGKEFREIVKEVAAILFYEATRDAELVDINIETPICAAVCKTVETKYAVVPVLRAGLGLVDGMLNLMPTIKVGHIGMYRDPETLKPVEYYCKLPDDCNRRVTFIIDPMLATGGTASAAIGYLKDIGVTRIKLLCLIGCPEGINRIQADHPDVDIYLAACDAGLNDHGYIVPGLGDAGDRLFGTK